MKKFLHLFVAMFFCFNTFSVIAGTLEDLKGKTGWQPRIHSEKSEIGNFDVLRIAKYIGKELWRGGKYIELRVMWRSPQADYVALKLFVLFGKGSAGEKSVLLMTETFNTTKGTHRCRARISEFTMRRYGSIKDCYAELWYKGKMVAKKQRTAAYSIGGELKGEFWWEKIEDVKSLQLYSYSPGLEWVR